MFAAGVLLIIAGLLIAPAARAGRDLPDRAGRGADPQDQHVGQAPLCAGQALAAQGRTVDGLGAAAAERASGARRSARRQEPGGGELTWRALSTIGAHDSGCLLGGPFSLDI